MCFIPYCNFPFLSEIKFCKNVIAQDCMFWRQGAGSYSSQRFPHLHKQLCGQLRSKWKDKRHLHLGLIKSLNVSLAGGRRCLSSYKEGKLQAYKLICSMMTGAGRPAQLRLPGAFSLDHAPGTDQRGPGICDASTVRVVFLQVTLGFIIVPLKVEILSVPSLSCSSTSGLSRNEYSVSHPSCCFPHWLRIS